MAVFISYSHKDQDFVNILAANLVRHRARVWVDKWELNVGDSIIEKVQSAIQNASALIVVLSQASVASEWCKKEIDSGLLRELEEKRVVVLPVLTEDCDIPLFLRGKLYADFRKDFDEGLRTTLEAIAKVTSDTLGRTDYPDFHIDWVIDWFFTDDRFNLRITMVEQAEKHPYSVLTEVRVIANQTATQRYKEYEKIDLDWFGRLLIFEFLGDIGKELQFILDDNLPKTHLIQLSDPKTNMGYNIEISCRRLGEETGKDIFIDYGGQIETILKTIRERTRKLSKEEIEKIAKIAR